MKFIRKTGIYLLSLIMILMAGAVLLTPPQAQAYEGYRAHHHPGHRGYVRAIPRHHHMAYHGGVRYYVSGGIWYRPWGSRFVVVAPPVGFVIPFLPPSYETVYVNGVPYYRAGDVYYAQSPNGYMIVNPPPGIGKTPATSSADQPFIYPRQGQSEKQQADDQYACHQWAVDQTAYDPTNPSGGVPDMQKRADYQRAMGACLEGRGYTVK